MARTHLLRTLAAAVALVAAQGITANHLGAQELVVASRTHRLRPMVADSAAVARRYAEWFATGRLDSLYAVATDAQRAAMDMGRGMQAQWGSFAEAAGHEVALLEERWIPGTRLQRYFRVARYSDAPEPVVLVLYLTPDAQLAYVGFAHRSEVRELDAR